MKNCRDNVAERRVSHCVDKITTLVDKAVQ